MRWWRVAMMMTGSIAADRCTRRGTTAGSARGAAGDGRLAGRVHPAIPKRRQSTGPRSDRAGGRTIPLGQRVAEPQHLHDSQGPADVLGPDRQVLRLQSHAGFWRRDRRVAGRLLRRAHVRRSSGSAAGRTRPRSATSCYRGTGICCFPNARSRRPRAEPRHRISGDRETCRRIFPMPAVCSTACLTARVRRPTSIPTGRRMPRDESCGSHFDRPRRRRRPSTVLGFISAGPQENSWAHCRHSEHWEG